VAETEEGGMELAGLRRVEWSVEGGETRREIAPAGEVELLVAAVLKLHHDPGVNPHNGRRASALVHLAVGTPRLGPGYWWTGPSLQDEGPQARLVAWDLETRFAEGRLVDPTA
jgi:hypothetical protein